MCYEYAKYSLQKNKINQANNCFKKQLEIILQSFSIYFNPICVKQSKKDLQVRSWWLALACVMEEGLIGITDLTTPSITLIAKCVRCAAAWSMVSTFCPRLEMMMPIKSHERWYIHHTPCLQSLTFYIVHFNTWEKNHFLSKNHSLIISVSQSFRFSDSQCLSISDFFIVIFELNKYCNRL